MPRFVPPHLIGPVIIMLGLLWFVLVHRFRQSPGIQRFVAETIGDDTPEAALRAFITARSRLIEHLESEHLSPELRQEMEAVLESASTHDFGDTEETLLPSVPV